MAGSHRWAFLKLTKQPHRISTTDCREVEGRQARWTLSLERGFLSCPLHWALRVEHILYSVVKKQDGDAGEDQPRRAERCCYLPTPPKGRLGRVMCMKPSFPQKPPLLVRANTCLTTWERRDTKHSWMDLVSVRA